MFKKSIIITAVCGLFFSLAVGCGGSKSDDGNTPTHVEVPDGDSENVEKSLDNEKMDVNAPSVDVFAPDKDADTAPDEDAFVPDEDADTAADDDDTDIALDEDDDLPASKSTRKIDGASLVGKLDTSAKSESQQIIQFANFLKESAFPYSLMDAEISEPRVTEEGENVILEFDYTCQVDTEKYDEFVEKLTPLLKQISPKSTTFLVETKKNESGFLTYNPDKLSVLEKGKHYLCVNTEVFNKYQSTRWQAYEIPAKLNTLLIAYNKVIHVAEITLRDKKKKLIMVKRFISGVNLQMVSSGSGNDERNWREETALSPYNLCSHLAGYTRGRVPTVTSIDTEAQKGSQMKEPHNPDYDVIVFGIGPCQIGCDRGGAVLFPTAQQRKVRVTLPKEDLARIATMDVEIIAENPDMDKFYEQLPEILKGNANGQ